MATFQNNKTVCEIWKPSSTNHSKVTANISGVFLKIKVGPTPRSKLYYVWNKKLYIYKHVHVIKPKDVAWPNV